MFVPLRDGWRAALIERVDERVGVLGARHKAVENTVARTSPLCPSCELPALLVGVADRRVNGLKTLKREVVGDGETKALRLDGHTRRGYRASATPEGSTRLERQSEDDTGDSSAAS